MNFRMGMPSQYLNSLQSVAEGLVDVEQEGKVLGLLQMELSTSTLKQLRGKQLQLVVMLTNW